MQQEKTILTNFLTAQDRRTLDAACCCCLDSLRIGVEAPTTTFAYAKWTAGLPSRQRQCPGHQELDYFFWTAPSAFRLVTNFEAYLRTSGESNDHRKSVRVVERHRPTNFTTGAPIRNLTSSNHCFPASSVSNTPEDIRPIDEPTLVTSSSPVQHLTPLANSHSNLEGVRVTCMFWRNFGG